MSRQHREEHRNPSNINILLKLFFTISKSQKNRKKIYSNPINQIFIAFKHFQPILNTPLKDIRLRGMAARWLCIEVILIPSIIVFLSAQIHKKKNKKHEPSRTPRSSSTRALTIKYHLGCAFKRLVERRKVIIERLRMIVIRATDVTTLITISTRSSGKSSRPQEISKLTP